MWFLIAGKPITLAKNQVNQSMTMEQLLEAEPRCCRVDQKDEKDSTIVNRKSSQRIDRLIQRKDLALVS